HRVVRFAGRLPLDFVVRTSGNEPSVIGAETHAPDLADVPVQTESLFPLLRVPQRYRAQMAAAATGEPATVPAEAHTTPSIEAPLKGETLLPRLGVPCFDGAVQAAGCNPPAVGAETNACEALGGRLERAQLRMAKAPQVIPLKAAV